MSILLILATKLIFIGLLFVALAVVGFMQFNNSKAKLFLLSGLTILILHAIGAGAISIMIMQWTDTAQVALTNFILQSLFSIFHAIGLGFLIAAGVVGRKGEAISPYSTESDMQPEPMVDGQTNPYAPRA